MAGTARAVLAALLILAAVSRLAAADIADANLVANRDPGVCSWSCLEMVGRELGLASLKGLAQARSQRALELVPSVWPGIYQRRDDAGGTLERIAAELSSRGVRWQSQERGNFSRALIEQARTLKRPLSISVQDYPAPGDYHAVLLDPDFPDAEHVRIIDPNVSRKTGKPQKKLMTTAWFERHWSGQAVLITSPPNPPRGELVVRGSTPVPPGEVNKKKDTPAPQRPALAAPGVRRPIPVREVEDTIPVVAATLPPRSPEPAVVPTGGTGGEPPEPSLPPEGGRKGGTGGTPPEQPLPPGGDEGGDVEHDTGPPRDARLLAVADPERMEKLQGAMKKGRRTCKQLLMGPDFGYPESLAEQTCRHLWGK